ncbi:Coproporphyrinogen-III oxidase [Musa troglodytarum]|uniref:Oxygen-dependent coproporphyrinogen-III oxidase, chloroplastic n=1 Tax=Musa troglodytarum TaxID=320322 RepID=A0A9E7JQC1_9LILI|nr:Coproporphyrinogen-III oxidase [Musa troglodytarum]
MPAAAVSSSLLLPPVAKPLKPPSSVPIRTLSLRPVPAPLSARSRLLGHFPIRAAVHIDKEIPENERLDTCLFSADGPDSPAPIRVRFEKMIREVQEEVCAALEAADGVGKFREDVWSRPGGGGGISRVLQDGAVWEKAGVNVSVVYGVMPPEAYRVAKGKTGIGCGDSAVNAGPVPFFAAGISSVLHPKNPFAPTLHFNYRYFETDAPKDSSGAPKQWWFGGGTDLTPAYIFEEDAKHFHRVQKQACDKFEPSFYPRFKKWCDDYFFIKHRGERRGLGGIFFDDLNEYDQELLLGFSTECAKSVVSSYIPIIERRKNAPFTEQHKAWQQLRRGRYVEFNLIYDRGTTFGLQTGGRIESILVSLPLTARWEYGHQQPEEGSEEWKLLDACITPKEWI